MTETAKEYGTALFMVALEDEKTESYAEDLELVMKAFKENPDYQELLASPSVSLEERLGIIATVFAEKISERVLAFLQLLCEKGRMACFFIAAEQFFELYDASKRVLKAEVKSATELTKAEKQKLKEKLEKKYNSNVSINYTIDKTLLAGIIIEIDGKVIDGSVRNRLRQVREVIDS